MSAAAARPAAFDVERIRREFPILARTMRGKPLVYLDTAASAQKPRAVIDAISRFYETEYANIHRGVYELSATATRRHDEARAKVAGLLGAADPREVVFVRNATEAVNLVAWSWARKHVGAGDEILITALEHHANIVPWQLLCEERGARVVVAPVTDAGEVPVDQLAARISPRTKLVAFAHVSNVMGTVLPVAEIAALAHRAGALVLVDGAQAVPRMPVDVRELGCDFYVFSGHKLYGPTGVGCLWARGEILEAMPPWQAGGDMIAEVRFEKTTFAAAPQRFEAGTPDIAGAVGLGAAIDWLRGLGLENLARHEAELLAYGTARLAEIPGLRLIGTPREKTGVISFVHDAVHPHDIGTILDQQGIAIRAGHHCAQPLMERLGLPATARASLGVYNTESDLDRLAEGVRKAVEMFS
ncbi:MAG TPA: cysteine desulfurase [Myxococcota bacterium]|nr:cysteine desulfurase [Myxococcota bacterium]